MSTKPDVVEVGGEACCGLCGAVLVDGTVAMHLRWHEERPTAPPPRKPTKVRVVVVAIGLSLILIGAFAAAIDRRYTFTDYATDVTIIVSALGLGALVRNGR